MGQESCTRSMTLASIFLELFPFVNFLKEPRQVSHFPTKNLVNKILYLFGFSKKKSFFKMMMCVRVCVIESASGGRLQRLTLGLLFC